MAKLESGDMKGNYSSRWSSFLEAPRENFEKKVNHV